ncbi:hypothetical protein Rm378p140 [Rhodothermus phage RM378]|uniref:hypothetical protein n=1 Tax=Rhodothermus phage RM378 TaxID=148943 RepID=UPI000018F68C|nr:hypothetical protein Rm378p140 [Rhodothermus phage RM378]
MNEKAFQFRNLLKEVIGMRILERFNHIEPEGKRKWVILSAYILIVEEENAPQICKELVRNNTEIDPLEFVRSFKEELINMIENQNYRNEFEKYVANYAIENEINYRNMIANFF